MFLNVGPQAHLWARGFLKWAWSFHWAYIRCQEKCMAEIYNLSAEVNLWYYELRPGVGDYFTRKARFGKTVKPRAARWLKNKVKTFFFWRSRSTNECDLQNKRFSPRFLFQFRTVKAYFFKNHCHPWSLKEKKVFRWIHGENLSLCKCRRARIKGPAGRTWPAGRSLPMSGLDSSEYKPIIQHNHFFRKCVFININFIISYVNRLALKCLNS